MTAHWSLFRRYVHSVQGLRNRRTRDAAIDIAARLCLAISVVLPIQLFMAFDTPPAFADGMVRTNSSQPLSVPDSCPPVIPADDPIALSPTLPANTTDRTRTSIDDASVPNSEPGVTQNPIHLIRGAVVERATDLSLSMPTFSWSHTRTYDSMLQTSGGAEESSSSGIRWHDKAIGPYLVETGATSVDLCVDASTSRSFDSDLNPPPDYKATLVKTSITDTDDYDQDDVTSETIDIYTLTQTDTGDIYVFGGFDADLDERYRGKLLRWTTREYDTAGVEGIVYTYDVGGFVNSITLAEPQEWWIGYTYYSTGTEKNRVEKIEVKNGAGTVIQKAEYTYYGNVTNPGVGLGHYGDLVQVKVSTRATSDVGATLSIVHYTQYRYYREEDLYHHLSMVFAAGAVERIIADNSNISDADNILTRDSTYSTGSSSTSAIQEFASRSFTYYENNNTNTDNNITTPWGIENLSTKYGGADHLEYNATNAVGYVKTETVNDGCASCGGDAAVLSYFYMDLNGGSSTDATKVVRVVVEDREDSVGASIARRIYGLNTQGVILRDALINDPTQTTLTAWCRSYLINSDLRTTEQRFPSAHTLVDIDSEIKKFLDPTTSTNDADTVNGTTGLIHVFDHVDGSGKRIFDRKAKEGKNGTAYYVSATDYGDGDGDSQGADFDDENLIIATYRYPTATTTRADGKKMTIAYTFHDAGDTQVEQITTTLPAIGTAQNGSGTATSVYQYYDDMGRLRWTKDGEGYVNYFSYHPETGGLAFTMVDVDTAANPLDSEIKNGSTGKWIAWTGVAPLTRDGSLPTALELVSKREYDDQGRSRLTIAPNGAKHWFAFEDGQVITFPYWDDVNDVCELPIQVSEFNDAGALTEEYSIGGNYSSISLSAGNPTGFSTAPSQSAYLSWTRTFYDGLDGDMVKTLQYHDVPTSGNGSHITNYYVTAYEYDAQGRRKTTIQTSTSTVHQVTQTIYEDPFDRAIQVKRGAGSSGVDTDADDDLGTLSFPTLATVMEMEFDSGGVGDGRLSKRKQYYATAKYTGTQFHTTYRGHLRGLEPIYDSGSGEQDDVGPYIVVDSDWARLPTAAAAFKSNPAWSTVVGDIDYAATVSTNRASLTEYKNDDIGRFYQLRRYAVNSSGTAGNYMKIDAFYDRNDHMVAIAPAYNAATEVAYDGAGRSYQARTVTKLTGEDSSYYTSAKFNYRAPQPKPTYSSTNTTGMSGGDDLVRQMAHLVFDEAGNTIEQHSFEEDYFDASALGLDITGDDDYVRRSVYTWYDAADRPTATADYGSGDTASGQGTWKYAAEVARSGTAPTASSNTKLVTKFAYHSDTGRLETVTDPEDIVSKSFLDDLGRTTYVAENYVNFSAPTTGIGGGTNNQEDRVTKFNYNGTGQVVKLTAYNGSSTEDQVTEYLHQDAVDASRVTLIKYPDGATTGSDNVQITYHTDGTVNTRTDQRGTAFTFRYNARRQVTYEDVTTLGGVDGAIRSIGRTYDNLGRVDKITSYNAISTGSHVAVNEVKFTYDDLHRITKSEQDHADAVGTGSSHLDVQYAFDMSVNSGVFNDGARLEKMTYPNGRVLYYDYNGTGATAGPNDRLNQVQWLRETSSTGEALVLYQYNGVSRMIRADYQTPDVRLEYVQGGAGTYNGFDRFGRVKAQKWDGYNTTADADWFKYEYDYVGNPIYRDIDSSIYSSNNKDQAYSYDDLNRLKTMDEGTLSGTTITGTIPDEQDWTLDQLGNWSNFVEKQNVYTTTLNQTRLHNDANEIDVDNDHSNAPGSSISAYTGPNWFDPKYDAAGNMIEGPVPGDETINQKYIYDAWNRLVKVTDYADNSLAEYEYDGLHRRIVKKDILASPDVTYDYYYNTAWQVLEVRKDGDSDPLEQNTWHLHYVDALAMRTYDADTDGVLNENSDGDHYYTHDANFNVTAVVNSSGTVLERYQYTPYGELQILNSSFGDISSSTIGNSVTYAGARFDNVTGLYCFRYRQYNGHIGRFLTRDPIGYDGSAWNLYEYVEGSPLTRTDPYGLVPIDWTDVGAPHWEATGFFQTRTRWVVDSITFQYQFPLTCWKVTVEREETSIRAEQELIQDQWRRNRELLDLEMERDRWQAAANAASARASELNQRAAEVTAAAGAAAALATACFAASILVPGSQLLCVHIAIGAGALTIVAGLLWREATLADRQADQLASLAQAIRDQIADGQPWEPETRQLLLGRGWTQWSDFVPTGMTRTTRVRTSLWNCCGGGGEEDE